MLLANNVFLAFPSNDGLVLSSKMLLIYSSCSPYFSVFNISKLGTEYILSSYNKHDICMY